MAIDNLYSVEEAAAKLGGVSHWPVRQWLSQGRIEKTPVGRRTMISETALEKFLKTALTKKLNARDAAKSLRRRGTEA